jgi:hypothetical protein
MTYRERRLARAERLRGWSDTRVQRATATLAADDAQPYAHDIAFLTQPGRIPERTRMIAREDRAYASLAKASSMTARADGIERAAAHAIYSDDDDAADRLRERIADLEAQRARIVAYNAACRKAGKCTAEALTLLDDKQRADMLSLARIGMARANGTFPAYALSNLSGNLSQQRARLERMTP